MKRKIKEHKQLYKKLKSLHSNLSSSNDLSNLKSIGNNFIGNRTISYKFVCDSQVELQFPL